MGALTPRSSALPGLCGREQGMTKRKTKAAALADNLATILPAGIVMSQQPDGTARCMIRPPGLTGQLPVPRRE